MSKQPTGMIIGQKGVQYGLQNAVPQKRGLQGASTAQRKGAPADVFGDDDSEEEDVERQIARQADKKRAAAKVQQMYAQALAEDPSVFDYDGVYDSLQQARDAPRQQDKVQRQSKYIASLLEQATQRKREQDVLYERRMVKERQQEDHLFEDKERFVTSAYRRKLEEDKKWQEAERQRELEEQCNDVRKVGHMGNFYANLLTKNVAYGAAQKNGAKHEGKDNGEKEDKGAAAAAAGQAAAGAVEPASDDGKSGNRETLMSLPPGGAASGAAVAATGTSVEGPSLKVVAQLDRYDVLRLEAERALRERRLAEQRQQRAEGQGQGQGGPQQQRREGEKEQGGRETLGAGAASKSGAVAREAVESSEASSEQRRGATGGQGAAAVGGRDVAKHAAEEGRRTVGAASARAGAAAAEAGTVVAPGGGKRRNDETAVMSARERYLARKQQKTS